MERQEKRQELRRSARNILERLCSARCPTVSPWPWGDEVYLAAISAGHSPAEASEIRKMTLAHIASVVNDTR